MRNSLVHKMPGRTKPNGTGHSAFCEYIRSVSYLTRVSGSCCSQGIVGVLDTDGEPARVPRDRGQKHEQHDFGRWPMASAAAGRSYFRVACHCLPAESLTARRFLSM